MAKKISAWWSAHKPTRRRLIQVYAALLYNAHIKGFIQGEIYVGPLKNLCVPGFQCYSCPSAVGSCPLGALQNALASSGVRAPYYVLGILMLYGLTLGRTICGWLCPLGLIQELLHKLPTPKLRKSPVTRALSWLKYVILGVFVIAIPLIYSLQQYPVPAFCKYICPAGTLEGAAGLLSHPDNAHLFSMLGVLFTRKFVILAVVLAACVFLYRAFCRFLCPLGAIYGLFARLSMLGVKVEAPRCTHCGRCVAHCQMDIRRVGDHECIHCGECIDVCPTGAISLKAGKILLMGRETPGQDKPRRRSLRAGIAWTAALAVLIGVMLWVNQPDEQPSPVVTAVSATATPAAEAAPPTAAPIATTIVSPTAEPSPTASPAPTAAPAPLPPVGKEIGMRCPDFSVPLYGGEGQSLSLAQMAGKPVILNFWATWCTPCVAELPYFQQVWDTFGDRIGMVALHSHMVTEDVQAYLDKTDYTLPFALDTGGAVIQSLGGSTMLPMTVVLDADGVIVYNQVGSVHYETLVSLITPLLEAQP